MSGSASNPTTSDEGSIRIRGARVHNLQNLDLDIPRDRLVVVTGPERLGQELAGLRHALRRGPAAVHREPVGLRPAVPPPDGAARRRPDRGPAADDLDRPAGRQPEPAQHGGHGHRDLRLPAAAVGPAGRADLLPAAASRSASRRPSRSSTTCWRLPTGTRMMILAPMVRGRKGQHKEVFAAIRKAGFVRARVDGEVVDVDDPPELVPPAVAPHRGGGRPRGDPRGHARAGWPSRSRWPSRHGDGLVLATLRGASRSPTGSRRGTTCCSARSTPAPTARSATRSWSRGRSASTAPTGPARRAKGWASAWSSTRSWSCPTASCRWPPGRSRRGRGARRRPQRKHQAPAAASFSRRPGSAGTRRWRSSRPRRVEQLLRGDGKQFPGVLALLEKEYARHHQRGEPAAAGGVSRRGDLRRVRRRAAAARGPQRPRRRQGDPRDHGHDGRRRPARSSTAWRSTRTSSRSPSRSAARDRLAAGVSRQRRPGLPHARPARPTRSAAASCSGCGWPPGWAPGWSASATCSTSRRSACTPATTSG